MYNITLICTAHSEIGNCNSLELYKIIEEYKPEIIFEELSFASYSQCYGTINRVTLETSAIKMYLQNHTVKHIPVVGSELTRDLDSRFAIMTKHDSYRSLIDNLMSLEDAYGFSFLNSKECEQLFEKIEKLEKLILVSECDEVLSRIYQWGNNTINTYENEVLKNVYHYSTENKYDKALMFIGAAHRKSIIKKIQDYENNNKLKLNWTFYGNQI